MEALEDAGLLSKDKLLVGDIPIGGGDEIQGADDDDDEAGSGSEEPLTNE